MTLYLQDDYNIRSELKTAQGAEEKRFSETSKSDLCLARNYVVMMSAF